MLQYLQGFWKALSAHDDDALRVFGELLALCDEFSVTLDYNSPLSGGEWVVMVAHFGDRTTFRFPRLDFNARDAYNQLLQRLDKAKKKAMPSGEDTLSKFGDKTEVDSSESAPAVADPVAKGTDTPSVSAGTQADPTKGESSETGTRAAAGGLLEPDVITSVESSGTTSLAKDAPVDDMKSDLKDPKAKPDNKTRRQ